MNAAMDGVHVPHDQLDFYDQDNIFHDGCPVCEARAAHPLEALAYIDHRNMLLLWTDMRAVKWSGGQGVARNLSMCDHKMLNGLYLIAVFLERHGIGPEAMQASLQMNYDACEHELRRLGLSGR